MPAAKPINEAKATTLNHSTDLRLENELPKSQGGLDTAQIRVPAQNNKARVAQDPVRRLWQDVENQEQPGGYEASGAADDPVSLPSPTVVGAPQIQNLQQAIAEIKNLRSELKYVKDEYRECKQELSDAYKSVGGLQHELSNVHRELDETKNLSEIRGRELLAAQVFLTKADSLSVSDVCDKLMVLNEEIFQAAASLGEVLSKTKRNISEADMKKHYERSCAFVGEPLVKVLLDQAKRDDPEVNMLIVQATLSVFLVGFCVSKLVPWHLTDRNIDGFLGNLYSEIRASGKVVPSFLLSLGLMCFFTEEQAVTGRWRALTRSKIRVPSDNWKAEIADSLKSVLWIAEWGSPNPKDQEVSFLQKLPPIFKAIQDVRVALGEKFTSADLEVNVVRATAKFESAWMEDAYGDGRQAGGKNAKDEMVVGTTGIGLKKIVIDRERGVPAKGQEMFENVVPPKVVLESTLRKSLDPPPPSARKGTKVFQQDGKG